MLLAQKLGVPLAVFLVLLNAPFILIGHRRIGPRLEALVMGKDEPAFLVISPVHEVSGGTLKRRVFH